MSRYYKPTESTIEGIRWRRLQKVNGGLKDGEQQIYRIYKERNILNPLTQRTLYCAVHCEDISHVSWFLKKGTK